MSIKKGTNPRKLKEQKFADPAASGGWATFSIDLLDCAVMELREALRYRNRNDIYREKNNHSTPYALGSIVMLAAAFDAWLNECIGLSFRFRQYITGQEVADLISKNGTVAKYAKMPTGTGNAWNPNTEDLRLFIDVRDEIVHHLPTPSQGGQVPQWFAELDRKGLLLTGQFLMQNKLGSYKLAYWGWEIIDEAVRKLVAAFNDSLFEHAATNFKQYKNIVAPQFLPSYDTSLNIKIPPSRHSPTGNL